MKEKGVCLALWLPSKSIKITGIPATANKVRDNEHYLPLFYFDEADVDVLRKALTEPRIDEYYKFNDFNYVDLVLDSLGQFNNESENVLYATSAELQRLGDELRKEYGKRIEELGLDSYDKLGEYVAHVALAYSKEAFDLSSINMERQVFNSKGVTLAYGGNREVYNADGKLVESSHDNHVYTHADDTVLKSTEVKSDDKVVVIDKLIVKEATEDVITDCQYGECALVKQNLKAVPNDSSVSFNGVIDVLYIPYLKTDYDQQFFHPKQTRFHAQDLIPAVLDFHGLAFGGSPKQPGKVKSLWENEMGKWATIELDKNDERYETYKNALLSGKLYVSPGGIQGFFDFDEESGLITDWATGEISLIVSDGVKRPKNWYAISRASSEAIIKANKIKPIKSNGINLYDGVSFSSGPTLLERALKRFLIALGIDRDLVDLKVSRSAASIEQNVEKLVEEVEAAKKDEDKDSVDVKDKGCKDDKLSFKAAEEDKKKEMEEKDKLIASLQEELSAAKAEIDAAKFNAVRLADERWFEQMVQAGKALPSEKDNVLTGLEIVRRGDIALKGSFEAEGDAVRVYKESFNARGELLKSPPLGVVDVIPATNTRDEDKEIESIVQKMLAATHVGQNIIRKGGK